MITADKLTKSRFQSQPGRIGLSAGGEYKATYVREVSFNPSRDASAFQPSIQVKPY